MSSSCKCSVSRHPERARIEAELVAGAPCRLVGAKYGISKSTIAAHRAKHIAKAVAAGLMRQNREDELAERWTELIKSAKRILGKAERSGDLPTALVAIRESGALLRIAIEARAIAAQANGPAGGLNVKVVFSTKPGGTSATVADAPIDVGPVQDEPAAAPETPAAAPTTAPAAAAPRSVAATPQPKHVHTPECDTFTCSVLCDEADEREAERRARWGSF